MQLPSLTFGNGILTAYLLYRQVQLPTIGILRGIASAIGLLGTCTYRVMVKRLGLEATGMWSIAFEAVSLGLAYGSVLVGISVPSASLAMLVVGVCASRIGLWVFDISVTQLQQERTHDGLRVRVGAVQSSLNAFFTLASFSIGFLFPDPAEFHVYVASAFFCVTLAASVYGYSMWRRPCPR